MEASGEVAETLRGLEQELLRADVRHNPERLRELLAEEFREFGSSGRVYADRAAIVEALGTEAATEFQLREFRAQMLGAESALVTYRVLRKEQGVESLRSSVWVWRDGRWQMVFHQGTRAASVEGIQ